MWSREELKGRAKLVLKKWYWIALLVTLIAAILSGALGGIGGAGSTNFEYRFDKDHWRAFEGIHIDIPNGVYEFRDFNFVPALMALVAAVTAIVTVIALIGTAIGTVYYLFVTGPINVGMRRYFLDARQDRSDIGNLFYSFRSGRYMNAVKAMGWQLLFTFLWTLLFVIPGIVKSYAYSLVPYIMADNPGMDFKRALKLSMEMTRGEKWNIFVLDLSFIGWWLLCLITCGIGFIFLRPYYQAVKAELYAVLRQKAINQGLCTADELGQPLPAPVE